MSSAEVSFRSEFDNEYAVDARGSFEKINKQNRRPSYRRSSSPPGSVNGIHKRRNSRWTWGHGRGARMENVRAFAHCVVIALTAACASAASAGVISLGTTSMELMAVGNAGNAGNLSAPSVPGWSVTGAVGYAYQIGKTEVTNSQYAVFLNSVQASGSNTFSLYNSLMGTDPQGGINFVSGNPAGSKYVVKTGFDKRPVNFVNWMDAARMANWLQNGQSPTGTETGAYVFTSGSTGVRQAGADYFVPNADEWYKAAFYSPVVSATNPSTSGTGGYWTYPTQSQTLQPLPAPNAASNAANIAASNGGLADVDAYLNAQSYYSTLGMAGNVAEWTDTTNIPNTLRLNLGGWQTSSVLAAASNDAAFVTSAISTLNEENANIGFRIAAVPEPKTFALLGMGSASMLVSNCMRRRKARAGLAG